MTASTRSAARKTLAAAVFETLESRRLLSVATGTAARFDTTAGAFDVELFDTLTPQTVANFLAYANSGAYDNTMIHRVSAGFVAQGGGYSATAPYGHIPENNPVTNEFNPANSNTRGKISMAKKGGDPNSATSEWFFNLDDNSQNLDNQNGGFTAFGQALGNGMRIVDQIAAKPNFNFGGTFNEIPLDNYNATAGFVPSNLIVTRAIDRRDLLTVALGDTTERAVTFRDGDGTTATVSLAGSGSAVMKIVGQNLAFTTDGATYTVTGNGVHVDEITASGLSNRSAIALNASGGNDTIFVGGLRLGTANALKSLTYRDGDGTLAQLRLSGPGAMSGLFGGNNLQLRVVGNTGVVTGSAVSLSELDLTGATAGSALFIGGAGGDNAINLGGIFADGAMGAIVGARAAVRSGQISIAGTLRQLSLNTLDHALVTIGGAGGPGLLFNVNSVANSDIRSSAAGIVSLRAGNWTTNDQSGHFVVAPWIGSVFSRGNLNVGLQLADANGAATPTVQRLGAVLVRGSVGGSWNINGSVRDLNVADFDKDFAGTVTGNIARLRSGIIRGNLTANSITFVNAYAMSGATLTITQPQAPGVTALGNLRLTNLMYQSMIRSAADVGMINVAGVYHSFILAGLTDTYTDAIQTQLVQQRQNRTDNLPTAGITAAVPTASDFASAAMIRNLNLRGLGGANEAFLNSTLAAGVLNRAGLRLTRLSQATETEATPFFIAARSIGLLGVYGEETRQPLVLRTIATQQELTDSLARQNAALGDLKIVLV